MVTDRIKAQFHIFVYCLTKHSVIIMRILSKNEEIANTWTHAAGILLGVVIGTIFIVMNVRGGDAWSGWSVGLYLSGMLCSYIASTVYHALPSGSKSKAHLRKWDHAAIYWHIAGSYSPITLMALRDSGLWGIGMFIFIWGAAIVGSIASFAHLKEHSYLETCCYVLMGLSVVAAFGPLWNAAGPIATSWIIAEGVMYITGAIFYSIYKKPYMHTVFHSFVLLGSVCHIVAVWELLIKYIA